MKLKRVLLPLVVLSILCSILFSNVSFADSDSYITLELDKTSAKVGDIINGTLKINNIKNFAGFQVNIRYNKNVLQPVNPDTGEPYTQNTMPGKGDLLQNSNYGLIPLVSHGLENGSLNFGRMYLDAAKYKEANKPESTGVLGIIGFKVLKDSATEIIFQDTGTLPNSVSGTLVFNWDGQTVESGYSVKQPQKINPGSSQSEPLPTLAPKPTLSADPKLNGQDSKTDPNTSDSTDNTNKPKAPLESKSESNLPIIIALSAIVVILIIAAAVFVFKKRK
jgi:hypothetical protein